MSQSKKKKSGRLHTLKRYAGSSRILPVVGEVIFSLLTMPLVYYFFEFFFKENLDTLDHYDLYHRCDPPRWRRYPACYQKKDEGRIITLLYSHT